MRRPVLAGPRPPDTHRADRGDIVLNWLVKVVVVITVLGVVGFDAVSVGVTTINTGDLADQAAQAASDNWAAHHDVQQAYDAARSTVVDSGGQLSVRDFRVEPTAAVRLTVRETAHTLLLHRIGPLRRWATVAAVGQAQAPS